MNEEIKSLKEYISTTKNEIFTTFKIEAISNLIIYYEELEKKVEQLENIRKEAIKWVKLMGKYENGSCTRNFKLMSADFNDLLNILNKGSEE